MKNLYCPLFAQVSGAIGLRTSASVFSVITLGIVSDRVCGRDQSERSLLRTNDVSGRRGSAQLDQQRFKLQNARCHDASTKVCGDFDCHLPGRKYLRRRILDDQVTCDILRCDTINHA